MSAKTSAQPGRRTPLSLSGTVTKTHPNKGGNNAANGGGNNANGHSGSNANKQDNNKNHQQSKTEQQPQTVNNSENLNKKQQQQAEKKQQQQQNENNKKSNEKNQNGVNNNKQQTQVNDSKQQQQQNKEKQQQQQQQQNGNDNKSNEKDKKEKTEKSDKAEKLDKKQEKSEKEVKEVKEDKKVEQDKTDSKKEEKKSKEIKENNKEDKKEAAAKVEEKTEKQSSQTKKDDKKSNEETAVKNVEEKPAEKVESMEVVEEQQAQQKSPPVTPKTNSKANKTSTPVNKTPTKANEKTPQKSTPSNNSAKTTPVTKRVVTTAVDDEDEEEDNDIEMEPLAIESSPAKSSQRNENVPCATSTPGKILLPKRSAAAPKTDVQLAMQSGISPERPRVFSQISGRKSIRPISDYTPSKFQMNTQFRESYRRINTELDVTNTSMNVTVGSEVPNNLSFSFFGRGRKRDRTPPQHSQSAIGELQTDMEISPPKRARLDMHGFFSVVSSPLSLLRNRFSKATLQSSTPVKLQEKLNSSEDEIEVQNVSGVSVHEDLAKTEKELSDNNTKTNDDNNDATVAEEAKETKLKEDIVTPTAVQGESEGKEFTDVSLKCEKTCAMEQACDQQSDIKITETPLQTAVGDPMAKNKRCIVM